MSKGKPNPNVRADQPPQGRIAPAQRHAPGGTPLGKGQALLIEEIQRRGVGGSRGLSLDHVVQIAESISVLGLLEPLVVDSDHQLLAGLHRLAAIRLLSQRTFEERLRILAMMTGDEPSTSLVHRVRALPPGCFEEHFPGGRIPVRALPFRSVDKPHQAILAEIAENESRRNYTASDVKLLAERLTKAGYLYSEAGGCPEAGQTTVKEMIAKAIGRSTRTVQRILAQRQATRRSPEKPENVGFYLKLPSPLLSEARRVAKRRGLTLSQLIRTGLESQLAAAGAAGSVAPGLPADRDPNGNAEGAADHRKA